MTAPTRNAELAYKVLDDIDRDPASWNQGWWFIRQECGTSGCFAGRTAILSGYRPSFAEGQLDVPFNLRAGWTYASRVIDPDGTEAEVATVATNLLGIPEEMADLLFYASNTREDLGRLVAEIFGPRPDARRCPNCAPGYDCERGIYTPGDES